jgi:hypothetical protein
MDVNPPKEEGSKFYSVIIRYLCLASDPRQLFGGKSWLDILEHHAGFAGVKI